MGLGDACRAEGNEALALLEFRAARTLFEQIGAKLEAVRAAQACGEGRGKDVGGAPPGADARVNQENVFRREGDYWSVVFEEHTVRLRDLKGLHYLARLLGDPGREFHVLDLVVGGRVDLRSSGGLDSGPLLDAQAKESYRRRLVEIETDIEDARAMGDSERAAQADTERDFIVRELSR